MATLAVEEPVFTTALDRKVNGIAAREGISETVAAVAVSTEVEAVYRYCTGMLRVSDTAVHTETMTAATEENNVENT